MSDVEAQYEAICDHPDCDRVLDIDCPIMCYEDSEGEDMTLCNDCYMEGEYWKTDCNEDNEEEIEEYRKAEGNKVFDKHYAENPILDRTKIEKLGRSDGFGVRDNNGMPHVHSMYEGCFRTYYVFRAMEKTAWVEVSPNYFMDSKIHRRYNLQRIIDDVNMKRERDEYDMDSKLFKMLNMEEIRQKIQIIKPKKEKKITKPKKITKRLVKIPIQPKKNL